MDFFDTLFKLVLPQIHAQFLGVNLKSEYYLHGWMMAMFVNVQGLEGIEFVLRIWDAFLLHGESILYCLVLAILQRKFRDLNNAPMQNWLDFFSNIKKIQVPTQSHIFPQQKYEGNERHLFCNDLCVNNNSQNIIPILQDALKIYHENNVKDLFKKHHLQQIIAEQKNEIFTKMYLNDGD